VPGREPDQLGAGQTSTHEGAAGELGAQGFVHQQAFDRVAIGETVSDLTFAFDLVGVDDLTDLRALLAGTGLRVALGGQGAITLGAFRLQSLCIHLFGAGWCRRLALSLFGLLAHDLGGLGLVDQAGLEQLFLQGIAHTWTGLAWRDCGWAL
jgi:hypothetical protein